MKKAACPDLFMAADIRNVGNLKEKYECNRISLRCLDNAIRVSYNEKGLPIWSAGDTACPVDREQRYYINTCELPAQVQLESYGRVRRSCLAIPEQPDRLECIWEMGERPALFLHADRCAASYLLASPMPPHFV